MLAQFKQICERLTPDEVAVILQQPEYLGVLKNQLFPKGYERCDVCKNYFVSLHHDCQAYKNYRENLCDGCVRYCDLCNEEFAPSGAYWHENCVRESDDSEESEEEVE